MSLTIIDKEIDRQFNLTLEADKSLETKSAILLGSVAVGTTVIANGAIISYWQLIGGVCLVVSGIFAIAGLLIKKFDLGPDPEALAKELKSGNKNLNQVIAKEKLVALKSNHARMKIIANSLKSSIFFLLLGIVITTIDLIIRSKCKVI